MKRFADGAGILILGLPSLALQTFVNDALTLTISQHNELHLGTWQEMYPNDAAQFRARLYPANDVPECLTGRRPRSP